jgi:hypothetical protein
MAGSGMTAAFRLLLDGPTPLKKVEDEHNDGEDEKNVYPISKCISAHQAEHPENEENDRDSPEHVVESPVTRGGNQVCLSELLCAVCACLT